MRVRVPLSAPCLQTCKTSCWAYNARKSDAGWSSLVARRAHNPKVVGSNPAPATNFKCYI
ncbi:hypothetical protein VSWAT3_19961 [Vibrionales bacterium SWAT-3]|nr:hypothetical protein VSWAT3_19961 [Vibrionales bacterium SWAT-3]